MQRPHLAVSAEAQASSGLRAAVILRATEGRGSLMVIWPGTSNSRASARRRREHKVYIGHLRGIELFVLRVDCVLHWRHTSRWGRHVALSIDRRRRDRQGEKRCRSGKVRRSSRRLRE